eukprot:SAG11_NODE_2575_length_3206_cov_1.588993_2_plen_86_part_00
MSAFVGAFFCGIGRTKICKISSPLVPELTSTAVHVGTAVPGTKLLQKSKSFVSCNRPNSRVRYFKNVFVFDYCLASIFRYYKFLY